LELLVDHVPFIVIYSRHEIGKSEDTLCAKECNGQVSKP